MDFSCGAECNEKKKPEGQNLNTLFNVDQDYFLWFVGFALCIKRNELN